MPTTADIVHVLSEFLPVLDDTLSKPPRSLGWILGNAQVYTGAIGSEQLLSSEEVTQWQKHYPALCMMNSRLSGCMVVSKEMTGIPRKIHLQTIQWFPVTVPNIRKLSLHLKIFSYIGISGTQPYNAFISTEVLVKDLDGRLLLCRHSIDVESYAPLILAAASVWFPPLKHGEEHPSHSINTDNPDYFRCSINGADVFDVETLDEKRQAKTLHLFWQICQFLLPYSRQRSRQPLF